MIRKILTYYAERLEEYLSRTHRRPEGLATVGMNIARSLQNNGCASAMPFKQA